MEGKMGWRGMGEKEIISVFENCSKSTGEEKKIKEKEKRFIKKIISNSN